MRVLRSFVFKTIQLVACFMLILSGKCIAENDSIERSHRISSYISNNSINAVVQDHFGRVWIATARGLNRFVGNKYCQYFTSDRMNSLPDNEIKDLYVDSKNRLWITTPLGTCILNEDDTFNRIPSDGKSSQNGTFLETKDHRMIVITDWEIKEYLEEENFLKTRRSFDIQKQYYYFTDKSSNIWGTVNNSIEKIDLGTFEIEESYDLGFTASRSFQISNGDIIVYGDHQIISFNPEKKSFSQLFSKEFLKLIEGNDVQYIKQINDTQLLISLSNNLYYIYDQTNGSLLTSSDSHFPISVPAISANRIDLDNQGNIWFCARNIGVFVWHNQTGYFSTYNRISAFFKGKNINGLAKSRDGRLIISVNGEGIYFFDSKNESLTKADIKPNILGISKESLRGAFSFVDRDGDLWTSSGGYALCMSINGNTLELKKSFRVGISLVFAEDNYGHVWSGAYYGQVFRMDKSSGEVIEVKPYSGRERLIVSSLINYNGKIVVGANPYNIKSIDPVTLQSENLMSDELFKSRIKGVYIPTTLYEDRFGKLWIGTNSNGALCYNPENDTLEKIEGTSCDNIFSFIEDSSGNIWMGSAFGLNKYNLKTKKSTIYYKDDGISSNQFQDRIACKLDNGIMAFGSIEGLTFVDPQKNVGAKHAPIVFEELRIYNNLVNPSPHGAISKSLVYNPEITITHKQKNFSISFAALDYSENSHPSYLYKMIGYDKDWIDAIDNGIANYSNIKPGKYTFTVKIKSIDEEVETSEASISVRIKPSPWASWWAIFFYIFSGASILLIIWTARRHERQAQQESRQALYEKEQEQLLNKRNKSFFANVAHEFRSPLTMISGPLTILNESSRIQGQDRNMLVIMRHNVNRMLELVNQFMDFNKLENDSLKLFVAKDDIVEFLKNYLVIYFSYAEQKALNFDTIYIEKRCRMYFDGDKIMKIISNLVSNAFKFTPSGGNITLTFDVVSRDDAKNEFPLTNQDTSQSYAKITVTDSGPGIPTELFEEIFKQYYQIDNAPAEFMNMGAGIGLHYAKAVTEMHHGYIKVSNRTIGTGAVFSFILPTDDSSYSDLEKSPSEKDQAKIYPIRNIGTNEFEEMEEHKISPHAPKIFVVDDDLESANYLKILLGTEYNVSIFYEAESALEAIKNAPPMMIVSDVSMPGKSGYDLCEEIKNDSKYNRISVILVTADSSVEGQILGLGKGADAYVTKPFDPIYLMTLIKSTIAKSEALRKEQQTSPTEEEDGVLLSHSDSAFLSDVYAIMEEELSNPDFDVDSILDRIRVSRSKFYYKIKELTGETPNELFKKYKLNKAAQLLKEGRYSISEISDMTGFSTCSYFSVLFKKQFGVSPSEYKNRDKKK